MNCECGYDFVKGKRERKGPALFDHSTKEKDKEKSWRQRLWPEIVDLKTAEAASKQGVWAAGIITVVTTALSLIVLTTGASVAGIDGTAILDGLMFGLIAWGIHRKSRAASVCGFLFYLMEIGFSLVSGHGIRGGITIIFFVIAFGNSMRGTFAYHKFHAQLTSVIDPDTGLPASKIPDLPSYPMTVKLLGGVFLTGFGVLLLLGLLTPSEAYAVLEEDQLSPDLRATIESLMILEPGERILYFYSDGLFDIKEGFYMLTDKALILWGEQFFPEGEKLLVPAVRLALDQITSIGVDYSGSWLSDSPVSVESGGWSYQFPLSSENGGDRSFITELEQLTGLQSSEFEPGDLEEEESPLLAPSYD
jgi:hypothetical protein